MSLFSYPIGRETPFKFILPNSVQVLYTAGNNGAVILGLRIAEVANATPTVTLDVLDAAGSVAYEIIHLRAFTGKEMWEAIKIDGIPVALFPGEKLRATASAASQLHVTGIAVDPPGR